MDAVTKLLSRILAKIPIRGTILTPSGEETFPVAISNEIMGGPFIVDSLAELMQIPVERLIRGCKCTVNEHTTNNVLNPTTTYLLRAVPPMRISDMINPNLSEFWILDRPTQQEETATEFQYAPDFMGTRPLFLSSVISPEAYNAGFATTLDFANNNLARRIWSSTHDINTHKWVRQRHGSLSSWGIPMKIDEGYEEGSYNDVRFMWRAKSLGKPQRPMSMVNGKPNNTPDGWNETPEIPEGLDYNFYIVANDLWRTSVIKGVFGNIITEWTDPIIISTNPQLVRYGRDAKNTDYLNNTYWRGFFSIGDKYQATRLDNNSPWRVEHIAGESGEYIDYVFKQFLNSYEPTLADAPTTTLGHGTNNWFDSVFNSSPGYTLHVSSARKYSNGELVTQWSMPVRFDGLNTIRCVIAPFDNSGNVFKHVNVNGIEVISPSSIKLRAVLFDGSNIVPASNYTVNWYLGSITGSPIVIGAPNHPTISGVGNTELTISPTHISNIQVITAVAVFGPQDYVDEITIFDVTDGLGYVPLINSNSGFIYKGTETKTFTAFFYENGIDISTVQGVTYEWRLNNTVIGVSRTVQINNTQVTNISNLQLRVSLRGQSYNVTEALTDVADGRSIERRYSSLETINLTHTPDTLGNPAQWSTSSAGAIWAIERTTGTAWNVPFRIKGESGLPNGAFQKMVFATHRPTDTPFPDWRFMVPTTKTVANTNLIPIGWTENPEANVPTGSTIWGSKATFTKNVTNNDVTELVRNWGIVGNWSMPFRVTHFPPSGSAGERGLDGFSGWTPVPAVVDRADGARIIRIVDYTGGSGVKPPVGQFVGSTGLVINEANAVNIRGAQGIQGEQGIKGNDGVFRSSDFWATPPHYLNVNSRGGVYVGAIMLRKAKNGIVYYQGYIHWHSHMVDHSFTLPDEFKPFHAMQPPRVAPYTFDESGVIYLTGAWVKRHLLGGFPNRAIGFDPEYIAYIRHRINGTARLRVHILDHADLTLSGSYLTNDVLL